MLMTPVSGSDRSGPHRCWKCSPREGRDRISNRAEIIDNGEAVDSQSLFHQGRADDPGVVGKFQYFAANGASECHAQLRREVDALASSELLPSKLKAAML